MRKSNIGIIAIIAMMLGVAGCEDSSQGYSKIYSVKSPSGSKVATFYYRYEDGGGEPDATVTRNTTVTIGYTDFPPPLQVMSLRGLFYPVWQGDSDLFLGYDASPMAEPDPSEDGTPRVASGFVKIHTVPYVTDPDKVGFRHATSVSDAHVEYKTWSKPIPHSNNAVYCVIDARGEHFHITDVSRVAIGNFSGKASVPILSGGTLFGLEPTITEKGARMITQAKIEGLKFSPLLPFDKWGLEDVTTEAGLKELFIPTPGQTVVDYFKRPEYTVVFGLGFSQDRIDIRIKSPISENVAAKFASCLAGKSNL